MPAGRFFHAEGAAGRLPEEIIGKTVWEANPIVVGILQAAGALLASRSSITATRTAGAATSPPSSAPPSSGSSAWTKRSARPRAGGHQQGEVAAGLGRGAHLEHDRHPARLVHLAPARLGRAADRVLLRAVRRAPHRPQDPRPRRGPVRRAHRRRLVRALRRRTAGPGGALPQVRRRSSAKRPTFSTCGSIPARATWPCSTRRTACPGPPTCTSRAATSTAAGSTARCWWGGAEGRRALPPVRHARLDAGRARPRHVEIARQLHRAGEDHQAVRRRCAAAVGRLGGVHRRRARSRRPSWRGCRRPIASCATPSATRSATCPTSIPKRTPSRPASCSEFDQWILLRAEHLVRDCRRWYEEFAFHRVYHAIYDFATIDLSALYFDVLRTASTPRAELAGPPQRADRALPADLRAGAPARAAAQLHHRRSLAAPAQARRRARQRPPGAVPRARGVDRGLPGAAPRARRELGPPDGSARHGAEEPGGRAPGEVHRRAARSAGAPARRRRPLPLLEQYAAELPGLFIVSQVALERHGARAMSRSTIERAAGAKCERCWKYTTDVGSNPAFPTVCAPCAEAVTEILNVARHDFTLPLKPRP